MHRLILLLAFALLFAACGRKLGAPHRALVGQWKATESAGGDTWSFQADGTFRAEGGAARSLAGTGGVVAKLARTGRWGEKDGVLSLDVTTLAERETTTYEWKIEGGRLVLSPPGGGAPAIVLDRAP